MLSLASVARLLWARRWDTLWVLLLTALASEIYLRTPWGRPLEYQADDELVGIYRPDQQVPGLRVNRDGHRGDDTDWARPAFVAVGDSNSWGSPVSDDEVWTARLERRLQRDVPGLQVVNASHPGHGPYHHWVRLRRALEPGSRRVEGALVRVSIEDRNFLPPTALEREQERERARLRERVRAVSRLAPFLLNKAKEQLSARGGAPRPPLGAEEAARQGEAMWREHGRWWRRMAELAARKEVPLVFILDDPAGHPGMAVLARRLAGLGSRSQVLHLDAGAYEIEGRTQAERWKQYRARFTFAYDAHGNRHQHDLVARQVHEALERGPVLASLRQQYALAQR